MHLAGIALLIAGLLDCGAPAKGTKERPATPTPAMPAPTPSAKAPADPAKASAPLDLEAELARPERRETRRRRFAAAVEQISRALGAPIDGRAALAEAPCGGWSGPGCSNLTLGLEAAKLALPIAARLYDDRAARIAAVVIEAVTSHSVWHDAYGFVHDKLGRGPGYAYAGCLLSSCDPDDQMSGQVDGLLYQLAREAGALEGPACGPACALP